MNRAVDASVFTRVCRKWKFSGFEMGPAIKRSDKSNFEVLGLSHTEHHPGDNIRANGTSH